MWDVLEDDEGRSVAINDLEDVLEQVARFWAFETELVAGLGERLARKASAEHVVWGNVIPASSNVR